MPIHKSLIVVKIAILEHVPANYENKQPNLSMLGITLLGEHVYELGPIPAFLNALVRFCSCHLDNWIFRDGRRKRT